MRYKDLWSEPRHNRVVGPHPGGEASRLSPFARVSLQADDAQPVARAGMLVENGTKPIKKELRTTRCRAVSEGERAGIVVSRPHRCAAARYCRVGISRREPTTQVVGTSPGEHWTEKRPLPCAPVEGSLDLFAFTGAGLTPRHQQLDCRRSAAAGLEISTNIRPPASSSPATTPTRTR